MKNEAELERLAVLSEELGEVQQVIGKILRHGYESSNPLIENSKTNRQLLEMELGDVTLALRLMVDGGDLDYDKILSRSFTKVEKINKWLHHNKAKI